MWCRSLQSCISLQGGPTEIPSVTLLSSSDSVPFSSEPSATLATFWFSGPGTASGSSTESLSDGAELFLPTSVLFAGMVVVVVVVVMAVVSVLVVVSTSMLGS